MKHWAKQQALGLLRFEVEYMPKHGFSGLLCLSAGRGRPGSDPCAACPLLEFVPPERQNETVPCRHIPLNEKGETVESISHQYDRTYLEEQILGWMQRTAQRLEKELKESKSDEEKESS